jgi:hypothetical protein
MCKGLWGKLLLVLASILILGSESCGTHDHILLCDGSGKGAVETSYILKWRRVIHFALRHLYHHGKKP